MAKYKRRKDGRYGASIAAGYNTDGTVKRIYLYAKSEKELDEKIFEAKRNILENRLVKSSDVPLSKYADAWFEAYKASVGINTKAMYKNVLEVHIKSELGDVPIKDIVRSDIQALINKNQEHPRTCEIIRMTLNQIFDSAIEDKMIFENPCRKIVLPKKQKPAKRALTDLEKEAIKKADFTDAERLLIDVLYFFGLRVGKRLLLQNRILILRRIY